MPDMHSAHLNQVRKSLTVEPRLTRPRFVRILECCVQTLDKMPVSCYCPASYPRLLRNVSLVTSLGLLSGFYNSLLSEKR